MGWHGICLYDGALFITSCREFNRAIYSKIAAVALIWGEFMCKKWLVLNVWVFPLTHFSVSVFKISVVSCGLRV